MVEPLRVVQFVVPGDPVAKGRPRVANIGGFSRTYTPKKTVVYENLLKYFAAEAMRSEPELLTGPLRVEMSAYWALPKSQHRKRRPVCGGWKTTKPDLDNVTKCLDALNGIVWQDDSQVVVLQERKQYADQGKPGKLLIRVEQLPPMEGTE